MFKKKYIITSDKELHDHFQKHLEKNRNIDCGIFKIFMGRIEMIYDPFNEPVLKNIKYCPFCGLEFIVRIEGQQNNLKVSKE
uniref:ORF56 n=1 Tax=Nitrosopumilaceae spindle-shaped virus TaxID=3065433 RepID=A0AAT9JGU1_9VIRU